MEALSKGLTQKMLHGAMAELHAADHHHRPQVASTLSRLFLRGELPGSGNGGRTPPRNEEPT
jgi:glutamyl-tRNA reductase